MKRIILYIGCLLLCVSAFAQTDTIRYVLTKDNGGRFQHDGKSWAYAKDNVQDAINDLKDYLERNHLSSGCVYIGAGVYVPTESTEAGGDGILYTAFKIPEGIRVYGSFAKDGKIYQPAGTTAPIDRAADKQPGAWQTEPDDRIMKNGWTQGENNHKTTRHRVSAEKCRPWDFDVDSRTYLSGNHASDKTVEGYLKWNESRQMYDEAFPGNSYHVVWFGTNGQIETGEANKQGHYAPLQKAALLDGCVVCGGNAATQALDRRYHTAYGGGVYMVSGAVVRNCRITENAASRKGGGIYLDGGGLVEYCYVMKNQAKGIGLTDGYGGGIAIDYNGTVRWSMVVDNGASIGGGMAIEHTGEFYPYSGEGELYGMSAFSPAAAGCVIANNTSTTEGGGMAMLSGGTVNHMTIVRNHCSGNMVTLNGRRYGRSGGLFIDIGGIVFNSVAWGNTTAYNGAVQYSAYVPAAGNAGEDMMPYLSFMAVSNHDDAEWTGTYKQGVFQLQSANYRPVSGRNQQAYYPEFTNVPALAGNIAGVSGRSVEGTTDWTPMHTSDLVTKGLRTHDYVTHSAAVATNASIDHDLYGNQLSPVSTLGAFMSMSVIDQITPAEGVAALESSGGKTIKTLFVDPSYNATGQLGSINLSNRGVSWDNPLVYLGDALHYVSDQYIDYADANENVVYQILVKEGTVTAADRQANVHTEDATDANYARLRDMSIALITGVRLYGGFEGDLDGVTIQKGGVVARNPLHTPTVITGNISGLTYTDNVAHVVTLDHVEDVIFDGFKLYGGNTRTNNAGASGLEDPWVPADKGGAGILIKGGKNNIVRNCFIANCTAQNGQGAAIYAEGCRGLQFENLAIHNNSAFPTGGAQPAAVFLTGGSEATFDHCLLRGNIGGVTSDGSGTTITITNTAFHANGTSALNGKNVESGELVDGAQSGDKLLAVTASNGGVFTACAYNLIDDDLGVVGAANRVTIEGFTAVFNHNPNSSNNVYPTFTNPTTSIGVNESGLVTFYGGTADFMPGNMSPMVNAANDDTAPANVGRDISTQTKRNNGGAADVGPIENTNLPPYGEVIYVRTTGSNSNSGLSWGEPKETITAALKVAGAKEVWVAAGTYTEKITMIDGVSVYGGFVAAGNPSKALGEERDISNSLSAYKTIINGNAAGRVLCQDTAFTSKTIYEGLTLTNGKTTDTIRGAGAYIDSNAELRNCLITENHLTSSSGGLSTCGGAGVNMRGTAIVKNCIISKNYTTISSGQGCAAGVYIESGTLINSLIVDNKTTATSNILGAAVYVSGSSNFYNCTVANNVANTTGSAPTAGGIWDNTGNSIFYNCIFWGNYGTGTTAENFYQVGKPGYTNNAGRTNENFKNCYHSTVSAVTACDDSKEEHTFFTNSSITTNDEAIAYGYAAFKAACDANTPFHADYSLNKDALLARFCINMGDDAYGAVLENDYDIAEDIMGADRVQDCTIDKGAYEYNGAHDITFQEKVEEGVTKHIYYVTENGKGLASADSPNNAACAGKLQFVLDAAGRHKWDLLHDADDTNDAIEIVVRLAGYEGYVPTHEVICDDYGALLRSSTISNPLAYSIVVPRGITLEGGWESETFLTRSPLTNKTVLNGRYTSGTQEANVYHVLTFTELVYDVDHEPDSVVIEGVKVVKGLYEQECGRTVVDGCFVTGGQAVGQSIDRTASNAAQGKIGYRLIDTYYNPYDFGGAAIVPSYGHIRNCVIEGNTATTGGGALMLKPRALVSGCIIRNNTATGNGGGVYVYEPEVDDDTQRLYVPLHDVEGAFDPASDINRPAIVGEEYRYANIFTSTIVGNSANAGGGVYFITNLRMNSTVLWRNTANSNTNIAGQTMPTLLEQGELAPWEYPLQYCAVENNRIPGYNNISIASETSKGARWNTIQSDADLLANSAFYFDLKRYSLLTRSGMLMTDYEMLVDGFGEGSSYYVHFPSLSKYDIAGVKRTAHTENSYIEIGARVYDGSTVHAVDEEHLMKRIFVAMPEDVDLDKAEAMQNNTFSDWRRQYYAQEGSTMAYPFNRLDDALAYIQRVRMKAYNDYYADGATAAQKVAAQAIADTRFEIFLAKGTHYPYRTIKGAYSNTRGNTFLIPEGVAIYGGISATSDTLGDLGYDMENDAATLIVTDGTYSITLKRASTADILAHRSKYDINQSGIIEGWGLENQTILSGDVVNSDNTKNVFHVITAIAAEEYVGLLPTGTENTDPTAATWNGKNFKVRGKPIILDGLQITGGEAIGYDPAVQSTSTYYKGGAICVDGNWVTSDTVDSGGNCVDRHKEMTLAEYKDNIHSSTIAGDRSYFDMAKRSVGYRDIPLVIRNAYITNNKACMGGAIFTNGSLQMYSTQLAQNTAQMNTDTGVDLGGANSDNTVTFYGRGGAIQSTYLTVLVNCVFANNSALSTDSATSISYYVDKHGKVDKTKTYAIPNGTGGALCIGEYGTLQMLNCDVVRNKADAYPAIYAFAPNAGYKDGAYGVDSALHVNRHAIINTVFWGNENIINTENTSSKHYEYLMNPVSSWRYEGPTNYADEDYMANPEALWFCAYELDKWYEPRTMPYTDDANDFRRMPYDKGGDSSKQMFVPQILKQTYPSIDNIDRYSFNILINSDNGKSDGPNFINPSTYAGAEGYTPSADWMMSRMNNLVDLGWTFMNQEVTSTHTEFTEVNGAYGCGPYFTLSEEVNHSVDYDKVAAVPIKDDVYMSYTRDGRSMLRISKDPNPSHQQTYIDIGAYEYPHNVLKIDTLGSGSDAVDILWVAAHEVQDEIADGSSWAQATSDLQRAIETLLSSRNDHHKEIRLLDGEYMPRYTISGNRAFTFNTSYQDVNSTVPSQAGTTPVESMGYGVKSFTIRGGYSSEVSGMHSLKDYPSVITMCTSDNSVSDIFNYAFVIEDMRQRVKLLDGGESTSLAYVIPLTIEGVTFSNSEASKGETEGGAAVYYKQQMNASEPLQAPTSGEPKLTIKNCIFMANGKDNPAELTQPAVKIEQGGGEALIYNSLWHNNKGNSLDAVNTKVVNCTFAKNKGKVILRNLTENELDYKSELHNSILWCNGQNRLQISDAACLASYELDVTKNIEYTFNAIVGYDEKNGDGTNNNLSIENDNVMTGPNFTAPEAGDFTVLPSVRITSRASTPVYMQLIAGEMYAGEDAAQTALKEHIHTDSLLYTGDFGGTHSKGYLQYHDLACFVRLYDGGLERGAYESQAMQNRVIYLRPEKEANGTGATWETAYGGAQIQVAINAAAVYTQSHSNETSYIFSKGNNTINLGNVILRDGVMLYGSIQNEFVAEAERDGDVYTDAKVNAYVDKVLNDEQRCIAGTATQRTIISGFTAGEGVEAMLDGFEFIPKETDASPRTTPVLRVDEGAKAVVVRNSIIHDYTLQDGVNLAELNGLTLLYNSLVRDNNAPMRLGNLAYIENCTMVSNAGLDFNYDVTDTAQANWHFLNSIDFCGNVVQPAMMSTSPFAPYFHEKNTYYHGDLDASFTKNRNLWYQLHEVSEYLERVNMPGIHYTYNAYKETDKRLPASLRTYVNYRADRDLLGNPRVVNYGKDGPVASTQALDETAIKHVFMDYGCYQTWSTGNPDPSVGSGTNNSILFPSRNKKYYGGNYYPHEGSVVYINQDGKIVLDNTTENSVYNGFTENHPYRPGYLLIREGGSLFGQGNTVQVSYVAVQRNLTKRYGLMSLPFPLKKSFGEHFPTVYTTVAHIIYDKEGGMGVVGKAFSNDGIRPDGFQEDYFDPIPLKSYYYKGENRSAWNYVYAGANSPCWDAIADNTTIPANKGWLIDLGSKAAEGETERIIRFTGYGNSVLDFIYTEGKTVDNPTHYNVKTIDIVQYDDRVPIDGGADFTHAYNMGWNLVGVPYLVSAYRTGREIDEGEEGYGTHAYAMSAPRILYALDNNAAYKTFSSWENTAGEDLTVAQGFFTQTATLQDKETLHFVVPKYEADPVSSPLPIIAFRYSNDLTAEDVVEMHPAEQNGSLTYSLGSDGAKFMAMDDSIAQIYAIGTSSLRMSLLSNAPVDKQIPIGLRVPETGMYQFSVPESEAFDEHAVSVWLIDKKQEKVTNLLETDYSIYLEQENENIGRFYISLSKQRPQLNTFTDEERYKVIAAQGQLTIQGLKYGDQIHVFALNGKTVASGVARDEVWHTPIQNKTLYIVLINDYATKVLANE